MICYLANHLNRAQQNPSLEVLNTSDNRIYADTIHALKQDNTFNNDILLRYSIRSNNFITTLWHWLTYPLHLNALVIILAFIMGLVMSI